MPKQNQPYARDLDRLLVQQPKARGLIDGEHVLSEAREEPVVLTPTEDRPCDILVGGREASLLETTPEDDEDLVNKL